MASHSFAIQIHAPPEHVFDTWVDVDQMADWTEGLTRISDVRGTPGQTGTRYSVWFGRAKGEAEVTLADRPRAFDWRVRMGPLAAEFETRLEAGSRGTRLTETVRTRGVLGAAWSRILSTGHYRGSFRGELAVFAAICERSWAARQPAAGG